MTIIEVIKNKKQFLSLLLLADEQENMIDRYLERGTMYVLNDNGVKAECVVTDEGNGILEIKNIATVPEYQGKGYAIAHRMRTVENADKIVVLSDGKIAECDTPDKLMQKDSIFKHMTELQTASQNWTI